MLHITDITYRLGDRILFDQATVAIPPGRKVGLVGANGAGKSTLLKMILGEITAESGAIKIRPGVRIGHVGQEAPDGPESLLQTVLLSNHELTALTAESETTADPLRIAEVHTRLADIGAHSAKARAASLLSGLGFDEAAQSRSCASYSGGWRMRVALACVLFNQPDLLLLDEPTNYLDLEGVMWLENFLKSYPYTVLIVSHDRDLLNKSVTHIIHLTQTKLYGYTGGYDRFEDMRREQMQRQMALKSKQERERRHIQSFIDRFRAQANKAKQAQSRLKMLERMKPIATMVQEQTVPFTFPKPEPLSSPLIALEKCDAGYEVGKPILKQLDLRVDMDDRIALLGANGNGKSTFAKLLAARLAPLSGKMRKSRALNVGYFAQHQVDELSITETPLDVMTKMMPEAIESKVRARLGAFGFGIEKADRPIDSLSGGEKARLMFAVATFAAPQLLILDEPTNHLDVDSREALIHAINEYDGAILLITHDRHLLNACADRLWIVEGGDVKPFNGDLDDYKRYLLAIRTMDHSKKNKVIDGIDKKILRRNAAEQRKRIAPYRKAAAQAEKRIEKLESEKYKIEAELADPVLYENIDAKKTERTAKLQQYLAQAKDLIEKAEREWIIAHETLNTKEEELGIETHATDQA